jgi:hypothetical protein
MTPVLPICYFCTRFNRKDFTCEAYPKGIPVEILHEAFDHRNEYKGDGGIRFELNKKETEAFNKIKEII